MEWWSVFRTARRAVFGVLSIVSLVWAILLSVYLAREWKDAVEAQRVIVLLMICMNAVFSVLLYLMIVVVFEFWLEFARTGFLFAAHLGVAVSLTIVGHTFDCSVFKSQNICTGTYRFSLFMEWTMAIVFLLHAITLCLMSLVPQPRPEELIIPKEKLVHDVEGQFHEIDLKSASAALSPGLEVTKVERVSVAPAMLMTLGSTPTRGPWHYARTATPETPSRSNTINDLPSLPYGALSVAGFVGEGTGRASPAPSYSSTDLAFPRGAPTPTTRRMRSLRLNRYAVDPLARNGSVNSLAPSSDSSHSAYSQISSATIGGFPRPPQAVVLKRSSSDASSLSQGPKSAVPHNFPPQLRPGTPTTARGFNFPRVPTVYSPSTNGPSRADTATPDSFHSVEPSLCFIDPKEREGAPAGEQDEKAKLLARQSMGLTRQPTQRLQLPNPFSPEGKIMRSPTI
ncbi:uncharacterized protein C8Q71DRAFT_876827 [Rhodofomes roseus]|uniref:Transmembrane protein n=1 Tax=Rhodofomes roseus TaxID=34475 RepID=A0ABQ8KWK0_9APHY|nr:uncharacterized protein C8Q71DRAFT_876827 [Rhodofomes roseus]KAH9842680.1 hypothetical protein C8Q71DRAFT_876827 [Rhodofomes roseus]